MSVDNVVGQYKNRTIVSTPKHIYRIRTAQLDHFPCKNLNIQGGLCCSSRVLARQHVMKVTMIIAPEGQPTERYSQWGIFLALHL